MRGIILAAGKGGRLEPVLPGKPKCLLQFGEKSLLEHQIQALADIGVHDIVIMVGYEQEQIKERLNNNPSSITYVENQIYDRTNTIYSLWLAKEFFDEDFIYFNADVLFDYRIVKRLCARETDSTLACNSSVCGEEEVKVTVDGTRIVEIGKHLTSEACYGEFIGIAKFLKKDNKRFAEILDECVKDESTWNYFFEYAVDFLAKETNLVAVDISDLPATEIDFPEDLERAREEVFPLLVGLDESGYKEKDK